MSVNFFDYSGDSSEQDRRTRPRLDSLSEEDWDHLLTHAARRRYSAGAVILAARSVERAIFILADGRAKVEGAAQIVEGRAELVAGDVFGFESFLSGNPPLGSVVATTNVDVLMFSADAFEQFAAWRPRVAILILRDLGGDLARRLARYESTI